MYLPDLLFLSLSLSLSLFDRIPEIRHCFSFNKMNQNWDGLFFYPCNAKPNITTNVPFPHTLSLYLIANPITPTTPLFVPIIFIYFDISSSVRVGVCVRFCLYCIELHCIPWTLRLDWDWVLLSQNLLTSPRRWRRCRLWVCWSLLFSVSTRGSFVSLPLLFLHFFSPCISSHVLCWMLLTWFFRISTNWTCYRS